MKMTRRGVLATASAGLATTVLGKKASAAAEFEFKLGVNTPETHPLTIRLVEAAKAIGSQSGCPRKSLPNPDADDFSSPLFSSRRATIAARELTPSFAKIRRT